MMFSIVIPSYGQAKYLRDSIQSALSQTYTDFEVIVVDDGSMDGSLEIAKEFEPQIKIIQQVNKGLASARNTGIMNAQGEYVFFLDADDKMLPSALNVIRFGIWGSEADVVAPSIRCVNEDGNTQDTILLDSVELADFKDGNRLAYCCAIKRSVLLEVGGYSPKMDTLGGWEDLHLWYDLMSRGKTFKTIQEPLVVYRVKEKSMWKDAENNKPALWNQIIKDFPNVQDHAKI